MAVRDVSGHPGVVFEWSDSPIDEIGRLVLSMRNSLSLNIPEEAVQRRLPLLVDPVLCIATCADEVVGFKLGYRCSDTTFFSWLGGVEEKMRRGRIATGLMSLQHDLARKRGFQYVETRCETRNRPMIILNMKSGFEIVGLEGDVYGRFVVTQRTAL